MRGILTKISEHLKRKALARRFGVPFSRRGTFSVPRSILLHGQKIDLQFPDDLGVKNDFLGCILGDCYGLWQLPIQPRTILDIGANVGFFSIAAREFFPQATIHAYEPNPRTLPYGQKNARAGKFDVFGEAVGATDGTVQMVDVGETNLAHTQPADGQFAGGIPQVSFAKTLARIGGTIDFLKMDCEGAEWDLFRASECWAKIRLLRMEYHLWKVHSFSELSTTLEALNFSILKHEPSDQCGLVWCERRSP